MGQILAQMLDGLPIHDIAVMGPMQDALGSVQNHPNAGAREGFHSRAQMVEKRFDFTPVDVATDRILEDRSDEMLVLVAHGGKSLITRNP